MFQIDTSNRGRDKSGPYNIPREESKVMGMMYNEREREYRQVLLGLAKSIQERDVLTYDHSRRIATYAHRLARYLVFFFFFNHAPPPEFYPLPLRDPFPI